MNRSHQVDSQQNMRVRTRGDSSFGGGWTLLELSLVHPGPPWTILVHPGPTSNQPNSFPQLAGSAGLCCRLEVRIHSLSCRRRPKPLVDAGGRSRCLRDIRDRSGRSDSTGAPHIPQLKRGGQLANLREFGETFPLPRVSRCRAARWSTKVGARTPLRPEQRAQTLAPSLATS